MLWTENTNLDIAAGIAEVDRLLLKLEKNLADAKLSLKREFHLYSFVKLR
jgi:hypothetical protein